MELIGTGYPVTPPSLSVATSGGNIALSWPATNGNGYSLYSTTNLAISAGWITATASLQTNGDQINATLIPDTTTKFFRLQKP